MLVSALIQEAYRESNVIPIGKEPSAAQQTEGLRLLNGYMGWLLGTKLGEIVYDWNAPPSRTAPVSARWPLGPRDTSLPSTVWPYPPNNVRLVTKLTAERTIYLPFRPCDGSRIVLADAGSTADLVLDANGKLIEGAATLTLTPADDAPRQWFYRADLASWQRVTDLILTDESPLPAEFDDLLTTGVSIRLSPRYGREPRSATVAMNTGMLRKFKAHYRQEMPGTTGYDIRMAVRYAHPQPFGTTDEVLYRP